MMEGPFWRSIREVSTKRIFRDFYFRHFRSFLKQAVSLTVHDTPVPPEAHYFTQTKENGDKFTGAWEGDTIKEGQGKIVFRDGSVYEGNFDGGKRNGRGTATYKYHLRPSFFTLLLLSLYLPGANMKRAN
jgi:hypothetical protein